MPVTLTAAQCPAPLILTALRKLLDAENTTGANVPVARSFAAGNMEISAKLNRNAAMLELLSRFGGGGIGIVSGLALTAGAALTLNIAAGQAQVDGLVEVSNATTRPMPDNHPGLPDDPDDRIWVWLLQGGGVTETLDTTPPATACCLLGNVTTAGGVITGIDTSGVMFIRSGKLERETADIGPPTDTPNAALRFETKTPTGRYLWDGTAHRRLWEPMQMQPDMIAASEMQFLPAGQHALVMDGLSVEGSLVIEGRMTNVF